MIKSFPDIINKGHRIHEVWELFTEKRMKI